MKTILNLTLICAIAIILLNSCKEDSGQQNVSIQTNTSIMKIHSDSFKNNGQIPSKYTCEGENISPSLIISNIPNNTKSLALIVDDSDGISGVWVHWIVWNIDPSITKIEEGKSTGVEGVTSFGNTGYGGPCPPSGTHRYVFKLFALDTILELPVTANTDKLVSKMNGHIIGTTELTGLYSKNSQN